MTKCYPGKSLGGHGDRVPSREEQSLCRPWLDQEIKLVNPKLIIPIGRLAIGLFFDTQLSQDGRVIIPLPHPSGASTWYSHAGNQTRVKKAIRLIRQQREALGL